MFITPYKRLDSQSLGSLYCNTTHCVCRCHLTTCHIALWELRLGELAQENDDTLAIAISVNNKPFLVFDPGITYLLPEFMGNTDNEVDKPSRKKQLSGREGKDEQRFL